ncbi:maternal effect embryoarrest 60 [Carex littledalei]|uniref:Maternal effect embryoarrest 60 n=1 Tax=Carex littledalei TaxID=544730 RepID=A0A833VFC7_9POAL|nr:maternal effect embryoarrest 60 [Carex littledalei]
MASSNEYGIQQKNNDTSTTSIHVMALDEVVSANSLFTAAVFVGISLTSATSNNSLSSCNAGIDMVRNVIVFEVISFSCFLFSSIVAQGMKLAVNLINSNDPDEAFEAEVNTKLFSVGMVCAGIGSIFGFIFLLLSLVYVVQIQLGLLSCGGEATIRAVTALVVLVGSALALYVWTIYYSFTH